MRPAITYTGPSLTGILLVVIVALKLAGVLTWSWWAVIFAPIAISLALGLTLALLGALFAGLMILLDGWMSDK